MIRETLRAAGSIGLWLIGEVAAELRPRRRRYVGRHEAGHVTYSGPERVTAPDEVEATRARIDERAVLAEEFGPMPALSAADEVEVNEALDWLAGLQPPAGLDVELHRYEHAAGSLAYAAKPTGFKRERTREELDARVSTREMVLRFGEELGPVLRGVEPDEWAEPEKVGAP